MTPEVQLTTTTFVAVLLLLLQLRNLELKKFCRLKLVCFFFFSFSFFSIWLFSKKALRTLLKGAAVRLELSKLYKAYTLAHGGRNPSSRLLKIQKWNVCQKSLSLVKYYHGMINEDFFGYVDVKVIIGEKRSIFS